MQSLGFFTRAILNNKGFENETKPSLQHNSARTHPHRHAGCLRAGCLHSPAQLQPAAAPTSANQPVAAAAQPAAQSAASTVKVNLNTASNTDFLAIPNVGNNMLREFLEYRPYASILQFRREIGKYVSTQQVAEYEKYVFVPISANSSDAATLQQIPALDSAKAQQLISGRPYASTDAFLKALAGLVSESELTTAKAYLAGL